MTQTAHHHDDPLSYAIAQELANQDLKAEIAQLRRQAKQAADQAHQTNRWQKEAEQQRERAERLRGKAEKATKEARQIKHQAEQTLRQVEAEKARAQRRREQEAGPHATIKSDCGQVIVQLAYNQVHIHEPERWYMVSSKPLDQADKHRMIFCGLIDGIMAGDHGDFIKGAIHTLAGKWRKEHSCQRIEDLDLPGHIVNRLEDAGYELASEIAEHNAPEALIQVKGIGPATLKKIAKALRKEGLA